MTKYFNWAYLIVLMFTIGAASAYADTVPSSGAVSAERGSLSNIADSLMVKYWANYMGPSIGAPSGYTTDANGVTDKKAQNADNLFNVAYRYSPALAVGMGMPFNLFPIVNSGAQIKPLYLGVIEGVLIKTPHLLIATDVRFYTPIGDVAQNQNVLTGFRTSQITLYTVPDTRITLGCYDYVRTWAYGPNGHGFRTDFEFYVSPFANYSMTSSLSATLWSDILQVSHQFGKRWGLQNLPIDFEPGIKWDITRFINVNPFINIIPSSLTVDSMAAGMVVNAKFL